MGDTSSQLAPDDVVVTWRVFIGIPPPGVVRKSNTQTVSRRAVDTEWRQTPMEIQGHELVVCFKSLPPLGKDSARIEISRILLVA